jgi:hypothetical protein
VKASLARVRVRRKDLTRTHSGYLLECLEQRQRDAWACGYCRTSVSEVLSPRAPCVGVFGGNRSRIHGECANRMGRGWSGCQAVGEEDRVHELDSGRRLLRTFQRRRTPLQDPCHVPGPEYPSSRSVQPLAVVLSFSWANDSILFQKKGRLFETPSIESLRVQILFCCLYPERTCSAHHQSRAQADPFIYSAGIKVAVQVDFNMICFIKGDSEKPMSGWPRGSRPNASEVLFLCSEYRSVLLPKSAEILYSALPEIASAGIPYYTLRRIPSPGVP